MCIRDRKKTVYVESGETTEVEWENTPITGQIQITKTSADYNSVNGWPVKSPVTTISVFSFGTAESFGMVPGTYCLS